MTARQILEACGLIWDEDEPLENVLAVDFGITLDTELTEE